MKCYAFTGVCLRTMRDEHRNYPFVTNTLRTVSTGGRVPFLLQQQSDGAEVKAQCTAPASHPPCVMRKDRCA